MAARNAFQRGAINILELRLPGRDRQDVEAIYDDLLDFFDKYDWDKDAVNTGPDSCPV